MSKREHIFDCMRCEVTDCLNLFRKSEYPQDTGNELYVYSILGEKIKTNRVLTAHVCSNGTFLIASCFLTVPIYRDHKESYLSDILVQVTSDFKASMFLGFSGHYRQAMQVLRCAFENIISGVYFQSDLTNLTEKKAKDEDFARLNRRFNDWKERGRVNIRASIEVLRRINFLSIDEQRDWYKLYALLSKFIHTPEEFIAHVKHKDEEKARTCPAGTYFSEDQLVEWSDCFQHVFAVLLKTIAEFHPETFATESGERAVAMIKRQLKDKEIAEKIKVLIEIRKILSTVQSSD